VKLERLTGRIRIYPFEQERDRPILGYIKGDRFSVAVDAGHSEAHIKEFYKALEDEGLPLPKLTVLTHWHWDHTLAMHAVHGLCIANELTNRHILDFKKRLEQEGTDFFFAFDESVRREYANGEPVIAVPSDIVFTGEIHIDAGNCPIRLFQSEAPHTDDSTLIEVPGEGVLFLGDSTCGSFPEWVKDPSLCRKLAETVKASEAKIFIDGHWTPLTKEEVLEELDN